MDLYRLLLHEAGGAPGYCIRRRRAGDDPWDGAGIRGRRYGTAAASAGFGEDDLCDGGNPWEADGTSASASNGEDGGKTGQVAGDGEDPCEAEASASNGEDGWDGEDPCEAEASASNGEDGWDGEDPCEAEASASNGEDGWDGEDPCEAEASASNGEDGGKTGQVAADREDPCEAEASASNGEIAGEAEDTLLDMAAASDIFLVQQRTGGVAPSRLQTIRRVECSFWIDAAKRWVMAKVFGRVEVIPQWSWTSIMGPAVYQPHRRGKGDGSCVICACAVCIHAQHRLAFERRYGAGSFPYELSSVDYLRNVCKEVRIWKPWNNKGTDPATVLGVIKDELPEGLRTAPVPGWRACDLPFSTHFALSRKMMCQQRCWQRFYASLVLLSGHCASTGGTPQ